MIRPDFDALCAATPGVTLTEYGSAIAVVLSLLMLLFIVYFLYAMWRDERGARR